MHRGRYWMLLAGFALVLLLGAVLALALTGYGAGPAYAQESTPEATATEGSGIRTLLEVTSTVQPTATVEATATETTTPITTTGELTDTLPPRQPLTGTVPAGTARTITVVGEGRRSVRPDTASAIIGVEVLTDTVRAGTTAVSNTMGTLMQALIAQGIAQRDIQTSGFNISLERTSPGPVAGTAGEVVRYRVSNNVTVTIRDLEKVGDVLDAAIEAGANNIYGVNFTLANQTPADRLATRMAMDDADARAKYLADLAGVQLGGVVSVSEIISQPAMAGLYSRGLAVGMGGGGGGPISPGEIEVVRQLQVVYSIQ